MLSLVAKHSFITICLAVLLEEIGIPMPIPTDVLIMFAGSSSGLVWGRLAVWFVLITLCSAMGASGLYALVRRGGRPLVERYGRYVHLGPRELERAERLLERGGWFGIAAGRAIPGLRYVTVIACGLLKIPYWRFVTAHIVGSSLYVLLFLYLGARFGPEFIDRIHLPHLSIRLVLLAVQGIGLPALLVWLVRRAHIDAGAAPRRRAPLLDGMIGAVGAASAFAVWNIAVTSSTFAHADRPFVFLYERFNRPLEPMGGIPFVSLLQHILALTLLGIVALVSFALLERGNWRLSFGRQVLGLMLVGALFVAPLVVFEAEASVGPAQTLFSQFLLAGVLIVGIAAYTTVTVYGRALLANVELPRRR